MLSIKKVLTKAERQHATLNENCSISNFSLNAFKFDRNYWVYKVNSDVTGFGVLCWKVHALNQTDPIFQVKWIFS